MRTGKRRWAMLIGQLLCVSLLWWLVPAAQAGGRNATVSPMPRRPKMCEVTYYIKPQDIPLVRYWWINGRWLTDGVVVGWQHVPGRYEKRIEPCHRYHILEAGDES